MWRGWVLITALWLLLIFSESNVLENAETYWKFYSVQGAEPLPLSDQEIETACVESHWTKEQCGVWENAKRLSMWSEPNERFNDAEDRLLNVFMQAFLPPLALLVFGFFVAWVLRGFRKVDPDR